LAEAYVEDLSFDCRRLKAEVERLTKAGDAMCKSIQSNGCHDNGDWDECEKVMEAWNAAKEGKQPVRVLIACEYSGTVRDAFIKKGHDAISCDLLPTDVPGPHYQGDVFDVIGKGWDMMIAHPPCTHLAVSGARHFPAKIADGRQQAALDFVRRLMDCGIERIAIENPISVISSKIRKPDQIIQPWQFGHGETKATCLWLKGLPPDSDQHRRRAREPHLEDAAISRQVETDAPRHSKASPTPWPTEWNAAKEGKQP